jgi:hypothetical protein
LILFANYRFLTISYTRCWCNSCFLISNILLFVSLSCIFLWLVRQLQALFLYWISLFLVWYLRIKGNAFNSSFFEAHLWILGCAFSARAIIRTIFSVKGFWYISGDYVIDWEVEIFYFSSLIKIILNCSLLSCMIIIIENHETEVPYNFRNRRKK